MNAIYSGKHWTKRKASADYFHSLIQSEMRRQLPKHIHQKPVCITFYFNSKLDIDNHGYIVKCLIDGMKGYLIQDDTRKYVIGLVQRFHEGDKIIVEVNEC